MNKLVLAIRNYSSHMAPEGSLLQEGLVAAGWTLAGYGYGDGCTSVPRLLDRHQPEIVLVQDVRDWHRESPSALDHNAHFDGYDELRECGARVVAVFKDCWAPVDFQRRMFERMGVAELVTYASQKAVTLAAGPWVNAFRCVRTDHSLPLVSEWPWLEKRFRGIVTGARNANIYPLREHAFSFAPSLGLVVLPHPGYHASGCAVRTYLETLSRYKVSVVGVPKYGIPLAKIAESIAAGCKVVTDLPAEELPPLLDLGCVLVPKLDDIDEAINRAEASWDPAVALSLAKETRERYYFEAVGQRLNAALEG